MEDDDERMTKGKKRNETRRATAVPSVPVELLLSEEEKKKKTRLPSKRPSCLFVLLLLVCSVHPSAVVVP